MIESEELSGKVDSFESRAHDQQAARDRVVAAWVWLHVGVGVVVSLLSFAINTQLSSMGFVAYWIGGALIFVALRRLSLEPFLDRRFPLSRSRRDRRVQKRR